MSKKKRNDLLGLDDHKQQDFNIRTLFAKKGSKDNFFSSSPRAMILVRRHDGSEATFNISGAGHVDSGSPNIAGGGPVTPGIPDISGQTRARRRGAPQISGAGGVQADVPSISGGGRTDKRVPDIGGHGNAYGTDVPDISGSGGESSNVPLIGRQTTGEAANIFGAGSSSDMNVSGFTARLQAGSNKIIGAIKDQALAFFGLKELPPAEERAFQQFLSDANYFRIPVNPLELRLMLMSGQMTIDSLENQTAAGRAIQFRKFAEKAELSGLTANPYYARRLQQMQEGFVYKTDKLVGGTYMEPLGDDESPMKVEDLWNSELGKAISSRFGPRGKTLPSYVDTESMKAFSFRTDEEVMRRIQDQAARDWETEQEDREIQKERLAKQKQRLERGRGRLRRLLPNLSDQELGSTDTGSYFPEED